MAESSSGALVLRPARAGDRDGMLRITKDVWDGSDYVPFVWQRWLEEPFGDLCVATWDGSVVGLQHTSVQGDGSAWIEGIRVDESMRGRGIGAAMLQHGLKWARTAGCSLARLSTSSGNESSMRIARKAGLREVGRFHVLSGPTTAEPVAGFHVRLAHAGDLDVLAGLVLGQQETDDFYTEGWTVYRLALERLRLLVGVHAIAIAESTESWAMAIATASVGRPFLRVGYLRGSEEGMSAVGAWIQGQAGAAGIERVRAIVPFASSAHEVLRSLDFSSSSGFSMVLWECTL